MKFDRTGIILYVTRYEACIDFYQHKLGLDILFANEVLTCFAFGASYLMVEKDDEYFLQGGDGERIKSCLRMNVPNVKALADQLSQKGVEVNYIEADWGTVAKFFDPEGNLCAFKDSPKFEEQVASKKQKG